MIFNLYNLNSDSRHKCRDCKCERPSDTYRNNNNNGNSNNYNYNDYNDRNDNRNNYSYGK